MQKLVNILHIFHKMICKSKKFFRPFPLLHSEFFANRFCLCNSNTVRNIQKVTTEVSFGLKSHLKDLKKEKKVKESEVHLFLQEVKQFIATLCNHLLTKCPIHSHFARCCRSLNPVYMAEFPETCKKLFDKTLEKLVICKHIPSTQADAAKNEYRIYSKEHLCSKERLPQISAPFLT